MTIKIFSTVLCAGVLALSCSTASAEPKSLDGVSAQSAETVDVMRAAEKPRKVKKTKKRIWVIGVYR